jgi:hypothetical protein
MSQKRFLLDLPVTYCQTLLKLLGVSELILAVCDQLEIVCALKQQNCLSEK